MFFKINVLLSLPQHFLNEFESISLFVSAFYNAASRPCPKICLLILIK